MSIDDKNLLDAIKYTEFHKLAVGNTNLTTDLATQSVLNGHLSIVEYLLQAPESQKQMAQIKDEAVFNAKYARGKTIEELAEMKISQLEKNNMDMDENTDNIDNINEYLEDTAAINQEKKINQLKEDIIKKEAELIIAFTPPGYSITHYSTYSKYSTRDLVDKLEDASSKGDIRLVKFLADTLSEQYSPEQIFSPINFNKAFLNAASHGHLDIVKYFLHSVRKELRPDVEHKSSIAFTTAAQNGQLNIVQYLLDSPLLKKHPNIHAENDLALISAVKEKHYHVFSYLLLHPRFNLSEKTYDLLSLSNTRGMLTHYKKNRTSAIARDENKSILTAQEYANTSFGLYKDLELFKKELTSQKISYENEMNLAKISANYFNIKEKELLALKKQLAPYDEKIQATTNLEKEKLDRKMKALEIEQTRKAEIAKLEAVQAQIHINIQKDKTLQEQYAIDQTMMRELAKNEAHKKLLDIKNNTQQPVLDIQVQQDGINAIRNIQNTIHSHQSSFFSFKRLGSWMPFFNTEKRSLDKTVQSLIDNDAVEKVLDMMGKGYILNSRMNKQFSSKFYTFLSEDNALGKLNKICKTTGFIADSYLIEFILSKQGNYIFSLGTNAQQNEKIKEVSTLLKFDMNQNLNAAIKLQKEYPELTQFVLARFHHQQFKQQLFMEYKELLDLLTAAHPKLYLDNSKETAAFLNMNNTIKSVAASSYGISMSFSAASMEEYLDVMTRLTQFNQKIASFGETLESKSDQLLKVNFHYASSKYGFIEEMKTNMKAQLDTLYSDDFKSLERHLSNNKYISNNEKEMERDTTIPETAQVIIDAIYVNYRNAVHSEKYLNEVQQHDVDNLVNKRVKEVLDKYFDISPQSRETLIHANGKNGLTIMLESLQNIDTTLQLIVKESDNSKLSSLSATQRYTKEIKTTHEELGSSSTLVKTSNALNTVDSKDMPVIEEESEIEVELGSGVSHLPNLSKTKSINEVKTRMNTVHNSNADIKNNSINPIIKFKI